MEEDRRLTLTLAKMCDCSPSTASGPRFVITKTELTDVCRLTGTFAAMVCDVCDRPWAVVKTATL